MGVLTQFPRNIGLPGLAALAVLLAATGQALAHELDGTWCSGDGRRIVVAGNQVITPGGTRTTGAYNQRAFRFSLPKGERPTGATIWMEPKGPDSVRVSVVGRNQQGPPPHSLWQRCNGTA